jgi:hypothetical protein
MPARTSILSTLLLFFCLGPGRAEYKADIGYSRLLADTDRDGFEDGMEVIYGSSPVLGGDTPADNHINNEDINDEGRVDVADVLLATRIVLELYTPSDPEKVRADVVPDNSINAGDLIIIQRQDLGL